MKLVRAVHQVFGTQYVPESYLTLWPSLWTLADDEDPPVPGDPYPGAVDDDELADKMATVAADPESPFSVTQRAAFDAWLADVGGVGGGGGLTTEQVQDLVAAMVRPGTNVTGWVYDDGAGTLTLNVAGGGGATDPEVVRDTIAAALTGSGITVTANDAGDTITLAVADATTTTKGIVEMATTAEAVTGTDTARAVTPAGVRAATELLDAATKSDVRNLIAKGTSLTSGNQDGSGHTFPSFLATALGAGVSVANAGRPGWTSTELAVRDGGLPVVLGAFTLPAGTGTVAVTVTTPTGYWNATATWSGVLDVGGTLYPGTLVHQSNGSTTFARATAGSSVSVPAGAVFTCTEQTTTRGHLTVIEAGRNDVGDATSPTRVPADVAAMVANLSPSIKRYLVLAVLTSPAETSGSTNYTRIKAINDAFAAAHGTRYVDTRRYLIDNGLALNGLTATTADTNAIAADTVPPQLLEADGIHPNRYGYKAMAQCILNRLVALGWAPDKVSAMPTLSVPLPTPTVTFDVASLTTGAAVTALPVTQGTGASDQGTTSKRPTVISSGGKQWASFDGVDDAFNVSNPVPSQPYTVVMRVKVRSLTNRCGLMWPNGTGNTAVVLSDGSVKIDGPGGNFSTPAGQIVAGTEVVVGLVFNGASSMGQVGANAPVTGNVGTSTAGNSWWMLGYAWTGTADAFGALDLNKIKVYPGALSQSQLAQAIAEL